MSLARGTGLYMRRDQFGTVAKCPHCDRTDIPKVTRAQITCGGEGCRQKQVRVLNKRAQAKKKRKSTDSSIDASGCL